jgi:hypothetical protein
MNDNNTAIAKPEPMHRRLELPLMRRALPMFGEGSSFQQTVDEFRVVLPGVDFAEYVVRSPLPASVVLNADCLADMLAACDVVLMRGVPGSGKSSFVDRLTSKGF